MLCPKCGFEQPDALECARCGIIISKFRERSAPSPAAPAAQPPLPPIPPAPVYTPPHMAGRPQPPPSQARQAGSLKTFNTGDALQVSFQTLFTNIGPFAALTALATSPIFLYGIVVLASPNLFGTPAELPSELPANFVTQMVSVFVLLVAGVITTPLATAAVVYGVFQHLRGRHAAFGDCLQVGLRSIFPVLGVALLQGFAIGFGFMMCIVPGFILMVMFYVAIPVAVEERTGAIGAMQRSFELTEGYRLPVFGVVAALIGVNYVVNQVIGIVTPAGFGGIHILISASVNVFITALTATASAVVYYQLRSSKESINIDEIATVFD